MLCTMDTALSRSQYVRWRTAIFAIFLASGLSIAPWASRVPDIKLALEVDKAQAVSYTHLTLPTIYSV